MLTKTRIKSQPKKRSLNNSSHTKYDVNQRIQYYMNYTKQYLESPKKSPSLRQSSFSNKKISENQARIKALEDENTSLREKLTFQNQTITELKNKAEERKQIMKQLYLILKEKEQLEQQARNSYTSGLQNFLQQLEDFELKLNEDLLTQNSKIDILEQLFHKFEILAIEKKEQKLETIFQQSSGGQIQNELANALAFVKEEKASLMHSLRSDNSVSFRQVRSEQESSLLMYEKTDLQQEIIKWVRVEFGEDVKENNLMEFLKRSISKNPFSDLVEEMDSSKTLSKKYEQEIEIQKEKFSNEIQELNKQIELKNEELIQTTLKIQELENELQTQSENLIRMNEISEFNQQILEQNQNLLKDIDIKNDEIVNLKNLENQNDQVDLLSKQIQQMIIEHSEKIYQLNIEIQQLTNDYALKCEEIEDLMGQLESQEELVDKKQQKLLQMKNCMELQKQELQTVFQLNQDMEKQIQILTEQAKRANQFSPQHVQTQNSIDLFRFCENKPQAEQIQNQELDLNNITKINSSTFEENKILNVKDNFQQTDDLITTLEQQIQLLTNTITQLSQNNQQLECKEVQYLTEIQSLNSQIDKEKKKMNKQIQLIFQYFNRDILKETEEEIEPLSDSEIVTNMNNTISLINKHIQDIMNRSSQLSHEILKLLEDKDDMTKQIYQQNQYISILQKERQSLNDEFQKLTKINQILPNFSSRSEIDELNQSKLDIELSSRSINENENMKQAVKFLQKELDKAKKHISQLENELNANEQDEDKIQKQLKLMKEEIQKLLVENNEQKKQLQITRKQLIDSESGAKLEHLNALLQKFFTAILSENLEESIIYLNSIISHQTSQYSRKDELVHKMQTLLEKKKLFGLFNK